MPSRSVSQSLNALPSGTVLRDYVIESELGSGGFSIVYLARHHLKSDWLYAIKEYLPVELAARARDGIGVRPLNTEAQSAFEDGLRRFRDEAEQLRKFRNERYIVSCLNYFEENDTAYLVMDYDDGLPLSEFLRLREAAGQPFTEADLLAVVEPLLEGLTVVHRAGVLHRDIKPGNIFVRRQDDITGQPAHPALIDFGAAKQNYLERHSRSQAPYTPGYAAYEQVSSMGEIGPWTDIYSLGAVMWRMVAGGCPGDSRLLMPNESHGIQAEKSVWHPRPKQVEKRAYALNRGWADPIPPAVDLGKERFSSLVLEAIDRCLALYPEDRVQDCRDLSDLLKGGLSGQEQSSVEPERDSSMSGALQGNGRGLDTPTNATDNVQMRTKPFARWWLGVGTLFVILTIGLLLILAEDNTPRDTEPIPPEDPPVAELEERTDTLVELPAIEQTFDEATAAYERGDLRIALEGFLHFAEQSNAAAQFNLGVIYAEGGEGVVQDYAEAVRWFRLAAEQGVADAQYNVGEIYALGGEGVVQDYAEAVRWFHLAAEQGLADAYFRLGWAYKNGEGVPEDDAEAVRWYRLAAEEGDANAQFNLANIYAFGGEGVAEDDAEAVRWFRLAAEQGLADAQYRLAWAYAFGEGVPEDTVEAARWWRLAAEQGHAGAQFSLGSSYYRGEGVPEDASEAVRWFRFAAEQGNAYAQFNLGAAYVIGAGVAEDAIEAYAWFSVAEAQSHAGAATAKDRVAERMTEFQVTQAQELSRQYWTQYVLPFR